MGEPVEAAGDYTGATLNLAARVTCRAGQILVTETIRRLARGLPDVAYLDCGLRELRGVEEPQRLYEVVGLEGLG